MLNAFDWFGVLVSLFVPLIVIGLFRIDRSRRQAGLGRGASRTAALVAAFASSQLRSRLARVVRALKRKVFRTVAAVNYVKMTSPNTKGMEDVKIFEFVRLKCLKRAARMAIMPALEAALLTDGGQQPSHSKSEFGVPKKRSGHRAVCNEENLWIWGGYCPVEEMSEDEWDPDEAMDANTNEPRSPLFPESIVIVDDFIYSLFGTNAREYCSNVYQIDMRTLETKTLFDSIALVENTNFFEMERLNETYPNEFLFGRYRQEVVAHDRKLYAFGGGKIDGDAYGFETLPVFNLDTVKWEFVPTLPDLNSKTYPQQRKFHSCVRMNTHVYMFGGMYCDLRNNMFTAVDNFVWRLDLVDMRWQRLAIKMPCLTYFHAACVNSIGEVYFHGGVKTISQEKTCRINHLYRIALKIPRLSDLSWYKLLACYPKLVFVPKHKLIQIGVPSNYIDRISC